MIKSVWYVPPGKKNVTVVGSFGVSLNKIINLSHITVYSYISDEYTRIKRERLRPEISFLRESLQD